MSQVTVVSIAPVAIMADKPGLFPGRFFIPPADEDSPQLLVVGDSYHMVYLGSENSTKYVKVTDLASVVATSIVEDFKRGIICRDVNAEPGVFWVPFVVKNVGKECEKELSIAKSYQRGWFNKLIDMADDDWNKSHSPRAISDLQRNVATKLKMDKPWLYNQEAINAITCPACFTNLNPRAVVCSNCKLVLKPDEYAKMQFVVTPELPSESKWQQ